MKKVQKALNYTKKNQISILVRLLLSLIVVAGFLLVFFLCDGVGYFRYSNIVSAASEDKLQVHFVDVGQGDATIICLPSDKIMLVDTGESYESDKLTTYMSQLMNLTGHYVIDFLVLTHPDADHVGGTEEIAKQFEIDKVYRPKLLCQSEEESLASTGYDVAETQTYDKAITSLYDQQAEMIFSQSGISFNEGGAQIEFLAPIDERYSNTNNYSAVIKITYQGKSFLLTGDCEQMVEKQLLQSGQNLDCDVLKVSHHGSNNASSTEFLRAVTPTYACISVGENSYGLPNQQAIERLQEVCSQIYLTSQQGSYCISVGQNNLLAVNFVDQRLDFTIIILIAGVGLILIWGIKLPKRKR